MSTSKKDNTEKQEAKKGNGPISEIDALKCLTLTCLYLSSWEEDSRKNPGEKINRAWKGHTFDVLNELQDDHLILQFRNTKSVILTEEGIELARNVKDVLYRSLDVDVKS
jgi:hypothetical protein